MHVPSNTLLLLTTDFSVTGTSSSVLDALRKMSNGSEPAMASCQDINDYSMAVDAGIDGPNTMLKSGGIQGFSFDELGYNDTWNSPVFATRDPSVCPSGST